MSTVAYKVEPTGGEWSLARDGRMSMNYASRSAAYEVAVAEAEGDLRQGRDVVIEVLCGDEYARENARPEAARAK
jgi:hypothetical protein